MVLVKFTGPATNAFCVDATVIVDVTVAKFKYIPLNEPEIAVWSTLPSDGVCDPTAAPMFTTYAASVPANTCLLYTSPSPRDAHESRMPSSA